MSAPSILLIARETVEFPARVLVARLEHLLDRGWDACLVCDEDPELWKDLVPARLERQTRFGGPGERMSLPARLRSSRTLTRARGIRRATRLDPAVAMALAAEKPDLVHFPTGATALEGAGAARRLPTRVVVTLGGEDLRVAGFGAPGYYDPVWAEAAGVHLPDDGLVDAARSRGCPEGMRVAIIPPGADAAAFELPPATAADGGLRLLSAAPLEWTQGYEHALHAVRLLLDRGVRCEYRVVGAGRYGEAVAFARYQLGLEASVELIDPLTAEGLREQLAWADAFLHPAVVEAPSAGLLEAQAAGLPAVVSDAGGQAAAADGAVLVAPRRDPEALADRLAALAGDPDLRRRLGERGRERAHARRLADHLEALEELYRSLLRA